MRGSAVRWGSFVAMWLAWSVLAPQAAARRLVQLDGDVEVVQVDDFAGGTSRVVHELRSRRTGRVVELALPDQAPRLRTGMRVRVRGVLTTEAGGARPTLAVGAEAGSVEIVSDVAAAAAVAGARKAIVLAVEFAQDGKTVACTDAAIAGKMFTGDPSVDLLYQQASFGQLSWPGDTDANGAPDVVRVSIDDAGNDCDTTTWRSEADAAATALGVNLALYQHRVYVLPSTVACGWAGLAVIGCSSTCWAMVATCDRGDVYAHELGHNLGMYHASFDANLDGAVDATCPWGGWSGGGEYCDDSDFMGISTNVWRQTNAAHKAQMGWIPADHVVDVASSGTYAIAPLETFPSTTGLPLVLRIAKAGGGSYYVSYRRRIGYDANMRIDYADRTSIHGGGSGNTLLHGFVGDGQSFQDTANGIAVTQVAHDASAAQVAVTLRCGNGVIDAGEQCDGTNLGGATCGGCLGTPTCTSGCQLSYAACTNGVCDTSETCASCPQDCVGGARCGNGVCEVGDGESCVSCPADCAGVQGGSPSSRYCCGNAGTNPVGCDPTRCGASCTLAPVSVCCGDGACTGSETSLTCARDCPGSSTTSSTSTSSTTTSSSTSTTKSTTTSTSTSTTKAPTTSTTTSTSTTTKAPTTSSSTSSSTTSSSSSTSSTTTSSSTSTTKSTTTSTSTSTTKPPTTSSSTSTSSSSTTSTSTTSVTTSTNRGASTSTTAGASTTAPTTSSSTTSTTLSAQTDAGCAPVPRSDCAESASQRAQVVLRAASAATKSLRWKLDGGSPVGVETLGPASIPAGGVRLCLYDAAATSQPRMALAVAGPDACGPKPCWRPIGGVGLRYRNKAGTPDGITDVRIRARRGALGAFVRARGAALSMPPLGVAMPVTAQLVAGDPAHGRCWQSVFTTAVRNDATALKAVQQP